MSQVIASNIPPYIAPRRGGPVLGEFHPLESLWTVTDVSALFRSEQSARWFLRSHRSALVAGRAIAIHAGRMLVHPQRFTDVAMAVALRLAEDSLKSEPSAR